MDGRRLRYTDIINKVIYFSFVNIKTAAQAVVQHSKVQPDVIFLFDFPFNIRILVVHYAIGPKPFTILQKPGVGTVHPCSHLGIKAFIACLTVARA
ncbi:hypothetical protein D3C73_1390240 [compost metagenome]